MDIITYLLGIVLDIIEYIILMGMGRWVSSLNNTLKIAFSNFFEDFFFGCLSVQEEFRILLLCITDKICWHIVIAANRSLT